MRKVGSRTGSRLAVVLFNLGGPDSLDAVGPFLFNLFNDRAIIGAPAPLRYLLARMISKRRAPVARHIYAQIGGASPIVPETREQARTLERVLATRGHAARVFVAMRYWHPRSDAVAAEVSAFAPDRIVLLPLYPQFSSTTSASSLADWRAAAAKAGLVAAAADTTTVCCYPENAGFVAAIAGLVRAGIARQGLQPPFRLLFSAHGLPERVIAAGDPYQWQVERTVAAVVRALGALARDHVICYQSRVGPLKWIGPATDAEIARAGRERLAAVVVPVAFVSEHSETLVELDIEYRKLAADEGVPVYLRIATVGTDPAFIEGLADLIEGALAGGTDPASETRGRICAAGLERCPAPAAPAS